MKVNYALVLLIILLILVPVSMIFGWMLMHIGRPGERIGEPAEMSLGGDPAPGVTMELQTDAANWSYFSSTYLVPIESLYDFTQGSILYISVPFSSDGVKVVDVRQDGSEVTAYLLQQDTGLPGVETSSKVTFIVKIDQVIDDLQSLHAVTYLSVSNVLVQMLLIFDVLLFIRVVFLLLKRKDLSFKELVSFLSM